MEFLTSFDVKKIHFIAIFSIILTESLLSQTNSWTGATDTDWHKACNWSLNTIPVCTDSVVIPTITNYPVITGIAHCLYLNITSSAADVLTINSTGGGNLDISFGGGSCSGTITDNGGCVAPTVTADCGFNCSYVGACGGCCTVCHAFTNNTAGIVTLSYPFAGGYIQGGTNIPAGATRNVCKNPSASPFCEFSYEFGEISWTSTDGSFGSISVYWD